MKPPAFQFYPDDFLGGTVTMNNAERGLYITLLCLQWTRGAVSQTDIDRIATPSFSGDVAIVIGKFRVGKDGLFRNERLEIERTKQLEYRQACSSAGKSGASKRWGRHSHPIVSPLAKNGSPSPSPSPSPDRKKGPLSALPEIFDAWNAQKVLPQCLLVSDKRRRSLEIRLNDPFFCKNWHAALDKVAKSGFCKGASERGWKATFDWFLTPDAVVKIMEGKYDDKTTTPVKPVAGSSAVGGF